MVLFAQQCSESFVLAVAELTVITFPPPAMRLGRRNCSSLVAHGVEHCTLNNCRRAHLAADGRGRLQQYLTTGEKRE